MLSYVDIRFRANCPNRRLLPPYLGVTLRGALGYALKDVVCVVEHGNCSRCALRRVCPYPTVFDGVPPPDRSIMRRYNRVPQPFVLIVDGPHRAPGASEDATLAWGLRLFGAAAALWPYAVESFQRLGRQGIGQARVVYELTDVRDALSGVALWRADDPYLGEPQRGKVAAPKEPISERLRFEFHTPLHVRRDGNMLDHPSPVDLVLAARRRLGVLNAFYGDDTDRSTEHAGSRIEENDFRVFGSALEPWRIGRFSTRQRRRVSLSGTMGHVDVSGPWHEAADALAAMPIVHVGKGTSFGLGRVSWEGVA